MSFFRLLPCFVAAGLAPQLVHATDIVLADNGQTHDTIVQAAASEAEVFAAHELSRYLKKITGAEFPVVRDGQEGKGPRILVGRGKLTRAILGDNVFSGLDEDAFVVRIVGPDIVLAGRSARGTLYAVYSFLEKDLGCRWFNQYGEEFVPKKDSVRLRKINRTESPAFLLRYIIGGGRMAKDKAGHEHLRRYLVRMRDNGQTWMPAEMGGARYPVIGRNMHSFFYWLKRPVLGLFRKHPEYFSLVNGKRVTNGNLCLTNSDVRSLLTKNILDAFEQAKGKGIIHFSQMDTSPKQAFCECAECRALVQKWGGNIGAPMWDYLLELCRKVGKKYPEAMVSTLAYNATLIRPAHFKAPDNLIVIYTPLVHSYFHAFEDPINAEPLRHLKDWAENAENLWVWYYSNPIGPGLLPVGNLGLTKKDFRLFRDLGVTGLYVEHDCQEQSHMMSDLHTWLLRKLMWDPEPDVQTLIADFCDHFYGPASPYIREYVDRLEAATRSMPAAYFNGPAVYEYKFLNPTFLKTAQGLFDKAEALVARDPVLLLRVRQARLSLDYACLVLWYKLADSKVFRPDRDPIVRRWRAAFEQTIKQRVRPQRHGLIRKWLDVFLRSRLALAAPKALPDIFAGIAPERIRQVIPESWSCLAKDKEKCPYYREGLRELGRGYRQVYAGCIPPTDKEAAVGICATQLTQGELPFTFGCYDAWNKKFVLKAKIEKDAIPSGGYNFYMMGRTALSEHSYVWFSRSWSLQYPLRHLYNPSHPNQQWDIYVSLRFEGPTYPHGEKGAVDRVYVDRIVLVRADAPQGRSTDGDRR